MICLLFNRATDQEIVNRELYPFGGNKIRIKLLETIKISLIIHGIQIIENLDDLSLNQWHVKNVGLCSFNFAGIRITDILRTRWSDINDNRLQYRMDKNSK